MLRSEHCSSAKSAGARPTMSSAERIEVMMSVRFIFGPPFVKSPPRRGELFTRARISERGRLSLQIRFRVGSGFVRREAALATRKKAAAKRRSAAAKTKDSLPGRQREGV